MNLTNQFISFKPKNGYSIERKNERIKKIRFDRSLRKYVRPQFKEEKMVHSLPKYIWYSNFIVDIYLIKVCTFLK